jgi:hypothetical protein
MLDPLASTDNGFLKSETEILPFTWMWQFCKKVMFHPHENTEWYTVYCSRSNSILIEKQGTRSALLILPLFVFFQDIQCLFHSVELSCSAQKWCSSHIKTLRDRQYSCYTLIQFSLLNKVLNSHACNNNDSHTGDTLLLPFTWKGLFCTKLMFSTL